MWGVRKLNRIVRVNSRHAVDHVSVNGHGKLMVRRSRRPTRLCLRLRRIFSATKELHLPERRASYTNPPTIVSKALRESIKTVR